MPRLVNHPDRIDSIREAVAVLAVRGGIGCVDHDSVARELCVSTATVRRYVRSCELLPQLGLEWVERRRRQRRFLHARTRRAEGVRAWEQAVRQLEAELPLDERRAEEARAWHAVGRGARTRPALDLVEDQRLYVAACVQHLLDLSPAPASDGVAAGADGRALSLRAAVAGLTLGVCEGWATPTEVVEELGRRLDPLAPDVNDR